ncbi:MAG TPA: AmmeMemoRadiSam system protein B [Candidatus Binatia bacterium]|jgi:MEMO1 family protein
MAHIKRSDLAGSWYAGDGPRLRRQVDDLLHTARAAHSSPLIGLIVPHAGYVYSGQAAAAGYGQLNAAHYRRVVILAPSHFAAFRGVAVLQVDAFETPLGLVPVDSGALDVLLNSPLYRSDPEPFHAEHALEIQLPFLQRVLPAVQVVPALIGDLTSEDLTTAARALEQLIDGTTLFVVSSDFVHYGRRFGYLPFPAEGEEPVRAGVRALDMGAIERACAGEATAFERYVAETGATICGHLPIALFLTMHARRTPGELLAYYTSLDVAGDYEHCVSYASIAFPRSS